jgi:hypothetical protein
MLGKTLRFFNGTPAIELPLLEKFTGAGVYALYYTGNTKPYAKYGELNRLAYNNPIYVGKAVPVGWRQSPGTSNILPKSEMFARLHDHGKSIGATRTLSPNDFACRFAIMDGSSADLIATIESQLIKINRPLWNTIIDGFGNHAPGSGRGGQVKSVWDMLHPGRSWAEKLGNNPREIKQILREAEAYLKGVGL